MHPILRQIKQMKIRGAINIGLAVLDYLEDIGKNGFDEEFRKNADQAWKVRPTTVVAYNVVQAVLQNPSMKRIDEIRKSLHRINDAVPKSMCQRLRKLGKSLSVLTHCHSTEFVETMKQCKSRGMDIEVYVTETRPKMQGKITARALADAGIAVSYMVDDAEGLFMNDIDVVITGSDSIRKEGIVNKIGTMEFALLAKAFKKPFLVASSIWKIDTRKEFQIEFRPARELGFSYPGVKVLNPAFDITPWKYVSGVIVENGELRRWKDANKYVLPSGKG